MGCCLSRQAPAANNPTDNNGNLAPNQASTSRQALAASSPGQPSSIASYVSRTQTRPNAPLKPITPSQRSTLPNTLGSPVATTHASSSAQASSDNRHLRTHITPLTDSTTLQWTRARLERERNDWWDTRITGQSEIWSAVRMMVAHIQRGEVEQAQTLLDATECTCPNGEIWRGVFDEHGEWYRVPEWIVVEPAGLVEGDGVGHGDHRGGVETGGAQDGSEEGKEEEEDLTTTPFKIRCRLSSNQQDVLISMHKGEHVASLVKKLRENTGMPETTRLRIAFGGKFYDENKSLESNPQWKKELVLNIMVFE